MANIGRFYKRLFERDFGLRRNGLFAYLPERYKMPPMPGTGSSCIRFTNSNEASEVGVADYDAGVVSWLWSPAAAITPGAYARLEWYLTADDEFGRFRLYQGISGVDWWVSLGNITNPSFPTASGFNTANWLISPIPSCIPGFFGASVWRWTDGSPWDAP